MLVSKINFSKTNWSHGRDDKLMPETLRQICFITLPFSIPLYIYLWKLCRELILAFISVEPLMELDVVSSSLPSDVTFFKLSSRVLVTCNWEQSENPKCPFLKKKKFLRSEIDWISCCSKLAGEISEILGT